MTSTKETAGEEADQDPVRDPRSRLGRVRACVTRLRGPLLLALAGGLLLAAAFPPYGAWPLAPLGPAALALALRGRSLRASLGTGLVFGVAFFFPLLSWTVNVAWYAWLALAAADAVIFGVLAVGQRLLLNLRLWPLGVAGWWVAAEAVRDRWPWGGFPWGRLAMSQAGAPTQGWAAIGGAPVLTLVIALAGSSLAGLVMCFPGGRPPGAPRGAPNGKRRHFIGRAVMVVAAIGLAVVPAAFTLDPVSPGDATTEVAAVQGNVPRGPTLAAQLNDLMVTANHERATLKLAQSVRGGKAPRPDLVIWPENSTDIDPSLDPQVFSELSDATDTVGAPLLAGEVRQNPLRNAGQLWFPGTGPSPTQVYDKRRLVPFGEVIPFRSLLQKITPLTALQPVNFTAGHADTVLHAGKGIRLGDVICYEIGFDDLVRSEVTAGANLLTMQTNDATFERDGQTGETGQQLAMARLRAVEHDRAVVVASTTGYSAIVAPDGRLVSRSGTWRQAVLEGRVPLITHTTLADRAGAWPEYVIVALTVIAMIAGCLRGRRRNEGPFGKRRLGLTGARRRLGDVRGLRGARGGEQDDAQGDGEGDRDQQRRGGAGSPAAAVPAASRTVADSAFDQGRSAAITHGYLRSSGIVGIARVTLRPTCYLDVRKIRWKTARIRLIRQSGPKTPVGGPGTGAAARRS
ncbi:MAG: apolipoprotein N-acyltransferase [Streptosporangiales bacterium]|nr:apolipoprotein N-acyltransferase [Streptosporangiales bacterium]